MKRGEDGRLILSCWFCPNMCVRGVAISTCRHQREAEHCTVWWGLISLIQFGYLCSGPWWKTEGPWWGNYLQLWPGTKSHPNTWTRSSSSASSQSVVRFLWLPIEHSMLRRFPNIWRVKGDLSTSMDDSIFFTPVSALSRHAAKHMQQTNTPVI